MRIHGYLLRNTVIVPSLALYLCLPVWPTSAAGQPLGADSRSQERPAATTDAQPLRPDGMPGAKVAPSQASLWVDDIASALGSYFAANYPGDDFGPYVTQIALVRGAVRSGDRRAVKVEMRAFFTMLARRSHGLSEGAADELMSFSRIAMPGVLYGIFHPESGPQEGAP